MMTDLPQVVQVTVLPDFRLALRFDNGDQGEIRLPDHLPFVGYFVPLAEEEFFAQVFIDHGTLCWPLGIDLDPVVVHAWAMDLPIELAAAIPA
jgi:hypothetical protein